MPSTERAPERGAEHRRTFRRSRDQLSCDLGGETAILGLRDGRYYGLDAVGARIWELLDRPRSAPEIGAVLLEEYEVEPGRLREDVGKFLCRLEDLGLVEEKQETGCSG
jgi:hypothetical protein